MATASSPRFMDSYLGHLLGQANHAVCRGFEAEVARAGLDPLAWRVLAVLHAGPLTVGALARAALTQQPTLTKRLPHLVQAGWVRLEADDGDARRTRVAATAAGKRKAAALIKKALAHEAQVLRGLAAAEQRMLKAALKRLAQG
jgi:DNA-binding MarR family transcriptional regulator